MRNSPEYDEIYPEANVFELAQQMLDGDKLAQYKLFDIMYDREKEEWDLLIRNIQLFTDDPNTINRMMQNALAGKVSAYLDREQEQIDSLNAQYSDNSYVDTEFASLTAEMSQQPEIKKLLGHMALLDDEPQLEMRPDGDITGPDSDFEYSAT